MRIIVLLLIYFELSLFYAVHTPPPKKARPAAVKQVKTTPASSQSEAPIHQVGPPLAFPVAPTESPSTPISLKPKPPVPTPVKPTLSTTAKSTIHRVDKKPTDVALNPSNNAEIGTESVLIDVTSSDPDQIASETSNDTAIQSNLSAVNDGTDENVNLTSTTTLVHPEPTDVAFSRTNNAEISTESVLIDVTSSDPGQIASETSNDTAMQTNLSAGNNGTDENVNPTSTTSVTPECRLLTWWKYWWNSLWNYVWSYW